MISAGGLRRSARYLLVRRGLVTVAVLAGIVVTLGFARLFDMKRHDVAMDDVVPESRQPHRMPSGPAADVSDGRGRSRHVTFDDLLGPLEFDDAERGIQSIPFDTCLVVRPDKRLVFVHIRMVHCSKLPHNLRLDQGVRVNEISIQGCQFVPSSERSHWAVID